METDELDLERILAKSREEGILVKADDRWYQHKVYKFILDTSVTNDIVEQLSLKFNQNPIYGLVEKGCRVIENGYRIEFGYRKHEPVQKKTILRKLGQMTQKVLDGSAYDANLNHFATALVLDLPFEDKIRLEKDGKDPTHKSVLVIDCLDNYDSRQAMLYLMRTFYSAYQKLKTLSKT